MKLHDLCQGICAFEAALGDTDITGLTADSRVAGPGLLFAGLPGSKVDGAAFVPQAVAQGAAAVLVADGAQAEVPANVAVPSEVAKLTDAVALVSPNRVTVIVALPAPSFTEKLAAAKPKPTSSSTIVSTAGGPRFTAPTGFVPPDKVKFTVSSPSAKLSLMMVMLTVRVVWFAAKSTWTFTRAT